MYRWVASAKRLLGVVVHRVAVGSVSRGAPRLFSDARSRGRGSPSERSSSCAARGAVRPSRPGWQQVGRPRMDSRVSELFGGCCRPVGGGNGGGLRGRGGSGSGGGSSKGRKKNGRHRGGKANNPPYLPPEVRRACRGVVVGLRWGMFACWWVERRARRLSGCWLAVSLGLCGLQSSSGKGAGPLSEMLVWLQQVLLVDGWGRLSARLY